MKSKLSEEIFLEARISYPFKEIKISFYVILVWSYGNRKFMTNFGVQPMTIFNNLSLITCSSLQEVESTSDCLSSVYVFIVTLSCSAGGRIHS